MTMTTQLAGSPTNLPLGAQLQSARETLRMERKDAAAQLRLNESIIEMIENNTFPNSMPQIFIRGYIRSYGKLLQLPEDVIVAGLEPIKPPVANTDSPLPSPVSQTESPRQYRGIMKVASAVIGLTLIILAATWWQGKGSNETTLATQTIAAPEEQPATTTETAAALPDQTEALLPAGISIQPPAQSLLPARPATPIVSTNLNHNTEEASVSDIPAYLKSRT